MENSEKKATLKRLLLKSIQGIVLVGGLVPNHGNKAMAAPNPTSEVAATGGVAQPNLKIDPVEPYTQIIIYGQYNEYKEIIIASW